MFNKYSLVLASALALTTSAQAQSIHSRVTDAATTLRDQAMQDSIAYDLVESLSMEVGPRSAGSAGDKAAIAWAVEKLKSLGFENVHTEAVDVPHWERGILNASVTAPFPQSLVATSLGGSPGTPAEGIETDVVRVESLVGLRALSNDDLGGKIAYVDHVMHRARDGDGYSVAGRIRTCAHYIAAERGALATVIRSAGTSKHRVAHTGNMLNNEWGRYEQGGFYFVVPLVDVEYDDGLDLYEYTNFEGGAVLGSNPKYSQYLDASVWKLQVGIKYQF